MICFRNYPDESGERDAYGTSSKGVADPYFNVLDKNLFEDFLVSLRDAVDSGISLLVTNPQLAIDLGFIDTYHQVDALNGAGNDSGSDPYVPIKLNDPLKTGSPVLGISYITDITSPNRNNAYEDYYRNNYHQVVNTIPGLTDDPAYIWTDEVYYNADGLEYGELGRVWSHIEYNPGLQPGDKFLISSMINAYAYYAVPLESVKAGKVITKFADTYMHGTVERVNPYRNYATSIAVEPGTVVAGKQIGAKVFISFTDNVGNQKSLTPSYDNPGSNTPIENRLVELKSDYWIDYAYSTGSISDTERDYYKSLPNNIDNLYPSGGAVANAEKYWTLNGSNIVAQQDLFGDNAEIGTDTAESVKKGKTAARTRAGMKRRNTVSTSSLPSYTVQSSWVFPTIGVPIPSINTRALWWLSERLEYTDGLPQRPVGFEADAFIYTGLEEFVEIVHKACFISERDDVYYIGLANNSSMEKIEVNDMFSRTAANQDLAHAYLIPRKSFQAFKAMYENSKWNVADLLFVEKLNQYKAGVFETPITKQAGGYSILDKTINDDRY